MKPQLAILIETLRKLVDHDIANDIREGLPHCLELEQAIDLLTELEESKAVSK